MTAQTRCGSMSGPVAASRASSMRWSAVLQRQPRHGGARPIASNDDARAPVRPQRRRPSIRTAAVEVSDPVEESDANLLGPEFTDEEDEGGLSTQEVTSVLSVLCEETEISEMDLRIGSFHLSVRRSALASNGQASAAASAPDILAIPTPAPGTAFASTASMDLPAYTPAAAPEPPAAQSLDEDDQEESHLLLGAPKVGLMRRGKYVKGKRVGKGNIVDEGAQVKKGQVLGYIEQLGTFVPVEAPQAGEIISFIATEGMAVEYKQPLVELAPYFGGHIIGDSKHA